MNDVARIIRTTALFYGRTVDQLLSHDQHQPLAQQRQVAMWLCRDLTGESYPALGKAFNRDHTTIIYGVREIERRRRYKLCALTADITAITCAVMSGLSPHAAIAAARNLTVSDPRGTISA